MALTDSPLVAGVRDLGLQFLDNDVDISGQDAVTSVELPDDRTFWIFGDTLEGPFDTVRHMPLTEVLSNTGAIVPKQDISDGIKQFTYLTGPDGTRARQLIRFESPEHRSTQRLWAIHGTHQRGHLYLYYHRITMDQKLDAFETFQLDGMGIAKADDDFHFERLVAPDGTREFWKGDEPGFGVFIQEIDGWLYLWGSVQPEEKSSGEMYLARVRPEELEDLDAYEYLVAAPTAEQPDTEPEWSKAWAPTAPLFDNVPNEMSAAWNDYLGCYVSLTTYRRENILVICTPPQTHAPLAITAMRAGVTALVEKPTALSLAEVHEIAEVEQETGVQTLTVFQHRFGAGARRLRELVDAGALGRPLVATCDTLWFRPDSYFEVPWRGRWDIEGGGPTMGHGIHQFDLMLAILGDWQDVTALAQRHLRPTDTEDVSAALVRLENGAVATVMNSLLSPRETSRLRIDFEHASVEVEHLYGYQSADWTFTPAPGHEELAEQWNPGDDGTSSHRHQLAAIAEALTAGERAGVDLAEARRTLEFAAAIYASAFREPPSRPVRSPGRTRSSPR